MNTSYMRRAAARLTKLARTERGAIVVPVALLAMPLVAAVVAGVDYARILAVQARLQTAVDAAALVAGRPTNTGSAFADATALFYSNFGRTDKSTGASFMAAVAAAPVLTRVDAETVKVSASVTLENSLWSAMTGNQRINATTTVKRATFGMELALVLDVTGSMKDNDNIGGLRVAAKNLVDILYGGEDTVPNLMVSVVPYTASVNLGTNRGAWLASGSLDQNRYANGSWRGCVQARTGMEDRTDTVPSQAPFQPYFWASTFGVYKNGETVVKGDNDWKPTVITELNQDKHENDTVGPNLGCNAFPVVPLTPSRTTVLKTINVLKASFRGGTMTNLGLQAGWFTLSPKWSGLWGTPNSPLPYNTLNIEKVVVMMTDGDNQWYDWPGGAPGDGPTHTGSTTDADYTGYGRLAENRLNLSKVNNSNARTEINNRTAALCTTMKAQGIKIYTVVLGNLDAATKVLWQNCATKPEYYFNSPDKAALASAFTQIGSKLASLRISQ